MKKTLAAVMAVGFSCASVSVGAEARKRVILAGHDVPTPALLRKNLKEIEAAPFDGIVLRFRVEQSGEGPFQRVCSGKSIWQNWKWKRDWSAATVQDLKASRSETLTDNFVRICTCPGNLDWFDDEGWAAVAENMKTMAWLTREGGLKGILFDSEAYFKKYGFDQFAFDKSRGKTFKETWEMARRRGRETLQALADECPDMAILATWL